MAFDLEIAAITIYCEASGQSQEARLAVAHVICNRWKAGRWGSTIAEVCLRRMQFSEWNDDRANNANLLRAARVQQHDPIMQAYIKAYWEAVEPGASDPTLGATHYHDNSISPPLWTHGAEQTVQIGAFTFYKGVA